MNFLFNSVVSEVSSCQRSGISAVRVQNVHDERADSVAIDCTTLVLAAGPFTSWIFHQLFDKSLAKPENHVGSAHWFHLSSKSTSGLDDVALSLPRAAQSEPRLRNELSLVALPEESTIKVSGFAAATEMKHLEPVDAITTRKGKTVELKALTKGYLNRPGVDVHNKEQIRATGRAELSIANGGAPMIERASISSLTRDSNATTGDNNSRGVWLCYGFGRYGTMLAPGAARVLVCKIMKESSGMTGPIGTPPDHSTCRRGDKGKARA